MKNKREILFNSILTFIMVSVILFTNFSVSGMTSPCDLELTKINTISTGGTTTDIQIIDDILYAADHLGLLIYNISDPSQPQRIGQNLDGGTAHGIHVEGNFAYIADLDDGLEVYDVSDLENPQKVGTYFEGMEIDDVFVQGTTCYVVKGTSFITLDVSDLTNITVLGSFTHSGFLYQITCVDDVAFTAATTAVLVVLNISDAGNIHLIGEFNDGESGRAIFVEENIVYASCSSAGFKIVDISDLTNPVLLGQYENTSTSTRAIGVSKAGDYAFVCDYNGGLLVLDVKNPISPTVCDFYEDYGFFGPKVIKEFAYVIQTGGKIVIFQITDTVSTGVNTDTSTTRTANPNAISGFDLTVIGLIPLLLIIKRKTWKK
ncbi:MAG: LVIVD repeat-containing protein [Candidatus Odinarchaeota archaeon]